MSKTTMGNRQKRIYKCKVKMMLIKMLFVSDHHKNFDKAQIIGLTADFRTHSIGLIIQYRHYKYHS